MKKLHLEIIPFLYFTNGSIKSNITEPVETVTQTGIRGGSG